MSMRGGEILERVFNVRDMLGLSNEKHMSKNTTHKTYRRGGQSSRTCTDILSKGPSPTGIVALWKTKLLGFGRYDGKTRHRSETFQPLTSSY